jgi:hypothetical protein
MIVTILSLFCIDSTVDAFPGRSSVPTVDQATEILNRIFVVVSLALPKGMNEPRLRYWLT